MASGPRYRVKLRRRRELKTNYYRRRDMLKSGMTRAVIRKSTKHMRIQFVNAKPDGDITVSAATSEHLKNYGWNITGANLPAAYVTGYLAGKRALASDVDEAIADFGLQVTARGSRLFAALKGILDAGVEIPANDKVFPNDDDVKGSHLKAYNDYLSENDKDYLATFARYKKAKQDIGDVAKLVEKTKANIDKEF